MAALLCAALLSNKKPIAITLFLVPMVHSLISENLSDYNYYFFAFIEDAFIAMCLFYHSRLINHSDKFIIQIAITQFIFMLTQIGGWLMYLVYMPPVTYDNICYTLFFMQILIIIKTGGAGDGLIRMARTHSYDIASHSGWLVYFRNGVHL